MSTTHLPHDPLAPHLHDVLILEWWSEDKCVCVEYTDGMIRSWSAPMDDAIGMANEVFGSDRRPHVSEDGGALRWTHFPEEL